MNQPRAFSSDFTCRSNERYLLQLLRRGGRQSKASLARETRLSAAAVGGLIGELLAKGLVSEAGKTRGEVGQPATLYRLTEDGAYGLGVSVNRGHLHTVLVDFNGRVLACRRHDNMVLPAPRKALALIEADLKALVAEQPERVTRRIAGVGLAQAFNLGSWQAEYAEHWREWDDFDMAAALEERTGHAAWMQNDVNAAAVAECIYGKHRKVDEFVYFFFGSPMVQSLGGALVLAGECRSGASGNAGDLGLIPVPLGALQPPVTLGSEATFLTHRCSLNSLLRHLRSCGAVIETHQDFLTACERWDAALNRWLQDCVAAMECAVYALQAGLDFRHLILEGEQGDAELLAMIARALKERLGRSATASLQPPEVLLGSFGTDAPAIGAATLPLEARFFQR